MAPSPAVFCLCACTFFAAHLGLAAGVYVFKGDPFSPGPLPIYEQTLNSKPDGIPEHTEVFFPTPPGTYTPIIFVPGLFGLVYSEWYATVLANFAGYGYVVAGVDPLWPAMPLEGKEEGGLSWRHGKDKELRGEIRTGVTAEPEKMFSVLQWLIENLNQHVLPSGVAVDWDRIGLLSHSAGAYDLTLMLQSNKTFAKAVAFLEPFYRNGTLGYSIPALSYGTQYCTDSPPCCIDGVDYNNLYSTLECPKIVMNVTGYGHCDILNEIEWEACRLDNFCKTVKTNNRDLYREEFVPGVLASFFGTYLQGNSDIIKYFTTPDDMPVPLGELKYDLNC